MPTAEGMSHDVQNLLVINGVAQHLEPVTMEEVGWRERADLQRWVREHPTVIEPGLLLVSEEFADWENAGTAVRDRLDLLFIDTDGRPVVVELKRGTAPDRTESQALGYAAYCDQLSTSDLIDQYARLHDMELAEAREAVLSHAPVLEDDQPGRVRVRLVAEDFPPSVTATVLFLRDIGSSGPASSQLDIGCVKLTAYRLPDESHVISAQPIIPIPETEGYQVRRRRRETEEAESRAGRTRAANAVPTLQKAGAIPSGAKLVINMSWFGERERPLVEQLLADDPSWGELEWTGEMNSRRAVTSQSADEPQSLDAAYQAMREAAGLKPAPDATHAWIVASYGKSLRDMADELDRAPEAAELPPLR